MILGFDIDGVLYPWHEEVWKYYLRGDREYISFIDFWKYPGGWVAENEGSPIVEALVRADLPYISYKPPLADISIIDDIARLKQIDEIWYITSRPRQLQYDTAKWLKDFEFPFADNLIMADENGGKVKVVSDKKCDLYVEDRPKYLELLPKVTSVVKMIRPYNTYTVFDAYPIGNLYELHDYIKFFITCKKVENA